jgi:Fe-S-cluster-containing dehydrogenase component
VAETGYVYLTETGALSTLPLMESALLSTAAKSLVQIEIEPRPLIPARPLEAGEQYRFHFDMTKCIGCKCCVVACNEQNGNPAALNWRRVGEVEGGHYPYTQRHYLSMGCNHCVEPSCLIGCPVEAYTKDAKSGVVLHSADTCIGCQYCTWNCSYGVPQYNAARGVVGKCDLCHNRLEPGAGYRSRGSSARRTGASSLASGVHAGAYATFRGRLRGAVAAGSNGPGNRADDSGSGVAWARGHQPGSFHFASRATDLCVARTQRSPAFLAQP